MNDKKTFKIEETNKKSWSTPQVRSLGDAVDIIKNVDIAGSGDAQFANNLASG
jgi:hypothetical protein